MDRRLWEMGRAEKTGELQDLRRKGLIPYFSEA
jgi:hypothetical protein